MSQQDKVLFVFAEDQEDPVFVGLYYPDKGKVQQYCRIPTDGTRDLMRAFCVALLFAKGQWPGVSEKMVAANQISKEVVTESLRSTETDPRSDFVNTLGNFFLKRGVNDWPEWYKRCFKRIGSPLKGARRDKRNVEWQIRYTPGWLKYDYQILLVDRNIKRERLLDGGFNKMAAEMEQTFDRWTTKLLSRFLSETGLNSEPVLSLPSQLEPVQSPGKATFEFYKEQFVDYLMKALRYVEDGPWWKLYSNRSHPDNKLAQLGERIGEMQRRKQGDPGSRRKEMLEGDNDYLLEATHEVMLSASWRFPEITRAFDAIIDALAVIDRAEVSLQPLNLAFARQDWIREVGDKVPQGRIYLFLLYFTHLAIEAPNAPRTQRSRDLLKRNGFFSLLGGHQAGINAGFYKFHGQDLFCRDGENFHNLYFHEHPVQKGETLQSVIREKYRNGDTDFSACLQGLLERYEFLRGVPITSELLPIMQAHGKTTLVIVPPGPGDNPYQKGVTEVKQWIDKRNSPK